MPRAGNFPYNIPELRLQRFILAVSQSESPADAYQKAGYKPKSRRVAVACASRLLARDDVQRRIAELRHQAHLDGLLTLQEKRAYLYRVIMTPAGEVTEGDPLCASMRRSVRRTKDGTVVTLAIQMPDKLRALELDTKLAGELVGGEAMAADDPAPFQTDEETTARLARVMEAMQQGRRPRVACLSSGQRAEFTEFFSGQRSIGSLFAFPSDFHDVSVLEGFIATDVETFASHRS